MFSAKPIHAFLIASSFSIAVPAIAQEPDCKDPQTQSDMTICAGRDYQKADKSLNASYSKIRERLADDEPVRKALLEAQRAWIKFRDAECAFSTMGTEGGSIQPMLKAMCLTELTEQRIQQLDAHANCEEGDVTCS